MRLTPVNQTDFNLLLETIANQPLIYAYYGRDNKMNEFDIHAVTDGSRDNEPLDCPVCDGEMYFYDEDVIEDYYNVVIYQCTDCGYQVEI